MRIIGLDPGLRNTGWGIIEVESNRFRYVADGTVRPKSNQQLSWRLRDLHDGLAEAIAQYSPDEAAVEETFVNKNPKSTLKLGEARGVVVLVPALAGLPVAEYSANRVKKAVVGAGHASKEQIQMMVGRILPGCEFSSADAADALAVAICHANYRETENRWQDSEAAAGMRP
ncbi:MAG: crossover junction endodeoxyribonuclease RuvC [Rhodospirillaceae bacterium]|nr:crossover junction endodeoxyribonuclease RuvC [Rhodospirillaceae bacterium]HAA92559.1 crossover junction endodeoxyribonuclease RuvC [Rhodospirillaceae bacterium]